MKLTDLVTALEDYKQLVQNVIDPLVILTSINATLGLAPSSDIALPPPVIAALPAAPLSEKPRRLKHAPKADKPKRETKGVRTICGDHPNSQRDRWNRCKQCARDYAREWARKNKAAKTGSTISNRGVAEMRAPARSETAPISNSDKESTFRKIADVSKPRPAAPSPIRRRSTGKLGDELEYSKPIKCPKCGSLAVRFSRPEDFNRDTDSWTCLRNGCQVRISHIVLSVDHSYEPDAA